jgi:methyl-accepting chemotaxis protein-1 (serine sensor receptor)
MKKIFADMKIGQRLSLAFGLVFVFVLLAAALAMIGMRRTERSAAGVIDAFQILSATQLIGDNAHENMVLVSRALLSPDAATLDLVAKDLDSNREQNQQAIKVLDRLVTDRKEVAELAALKKQRATFIAKRGELLALVRGGQVAQASARFNGEMQKVMSDYHAALQAFSQAEMERAGRNSQGAVKVAAGSQAVLVIGVGCALILAAFVGFVITRGIVGPLARATATAEAVARGDFSRTIDVATRDEVGLLLGSMKNMQDVMLRFIEAQQTIARSHEAGDIDSRIDAACFPGVFGQMAQQINELVAAHIAVSERVVEVVGRYADGDFSVSMDALPGKQAQISAAMERVKASFEGLSREVVLLVEAAAAGDFSKRGDAAAYSNRFRQIVDGLNKLMQTADEGLTEVAAVLAAIAGGDLTYTIDKQFAGTFGKLKDDANLTVAQLRSMVGQIREATESIHSAANEIAAGNADLSRRTEQQGAALEETASSMEQMTSTVRQNAEHAARARQLTVGAADIAKRGGEVVEEAVATMAAIGASSQKISDIIGVMDGIAFQTNILALNAAVEAARAGEHGRGFAVVAGEVRNLAQRSAVSAREVRTLIAESAQQIQAGTVHVRATGESMASIVTAVHGAADVSGEIAAASQEQTAGIEQINSAITHMDETTQQNAAMVEQAAAAARAMEEQASSLRTAVARFRLEPARAAATPLAHAA